MTTDLTFITNEKGENLLNRFSTLIKDTQFFDCLVGYFYTSGFHSLYKSLEKTEIIRILIGISTNRETFNLIQEAKKENQQTLQLSHKETKDEFTNQLIDEMETSKDSLEVEDGYYFFHIALDIGRVNSEIAFITTNYYITADSAIKLRTDIKERANIRKLINFNELKIFESALGQHNLITLITKTNNKDIICDVYSTQRNGIADSKILKEILSRKDNQTEFYSISQPDLYDSDKNYIRILNNAKNIVEINNILDKIKINSTTLINICNISQGIVTGLDKVSKKHIKKLPDLILTEGEGCFILNNKEKSRFGDCPIIKPWFKNSDISKYRTNQINTQWLIHLNTDIDIEKYDGIFHHLSKLEKVIKSRNFDSGELSKAFKLNKWWALSSARKDFDFTVPKIVSPQRSYLNTFGYNDIPWYASADVYFITEKSKIFDLKYILGLLNSRLYYVWLYTRGKRKGEMLELYLTPLSEIPIKNILKHESKPIINLVDQILSLTNSPDYLSSPEKQVRVKLLEKEIDQLVYKLYDLTHEEIAIVENFNTGKQQ